MLRTISADELKSMREKDADLELLDLRPVPEFIRGSIKGAMNLPQDEPDFLTNLKKIWPHPGPVALISTTHDIPGVVLFAIDAVGGNVVGTVQIHEWMEKNYPVTEITAISLDEVLQNHDEFSLVDVRTLEEWQKRHIPGSVNLPLSELEAAPSVLDSNQPHVVFCAGVYRGLAGTAKLAAMGFSTRYLAGGVHTWYEQTSRIKMQTQDVKRRGI
ncbi:rhodanese-like domain-containing protein [Alicyclobacillus curvatus]|nr:rhodanese-like domain-containing protein [Alicyclobacillus curvatus]